MSETVPILEGSRYEVSRQTCIRCGACALLCPSVFAMDDSAARVVRSPGTGRERRLAAAALLNCPTSSIKTRTRSPAPMEPAPDDPPNPGLYDELAALSEQVRWHLADVTWEHLLLGRATPPLIALVKEMAFSEHATYSATQRFMQMFADDVEFTQWLSVWFYEETRHPHVLTAWLRQVSAAPADEIDFAQRGRVSTPLMKSKIGTLVTNIVSEVTAAFAYGSMARASSEPLLAQIARFISADEARHAASFFRFALRRLESAGDPAREQLDCLKVLHFWMNESQQVTHPINQMLVRLGAETGSEALSELTFDFNAVKRRATRIIGQLIEEPLDTPEDVLLALKQRTGDLHESRRMAGAAIGIGTDHRGQSSPTDPDVRD